MDWKFNVIQSNLEKIRRFFWIILNYFAFFGVYFNYSAVSLETRPKCGQIQMKFQEKFRNFFCQGSKRLEILWWQIILNGSKQMKEDSPIFMSCIYLFMGSATCGRALSLSKISFSWRLAYSGRFFFNAGLSFINCCL